MMTEVSSFNQISIFRLIKTIKLVIRDMMKMRIKIKKSQNLIQINKMMTEVSTIKDFLIKLLWKSRIKSLNLIHSIKIMMMMTKMITKMMVQMKFKMSKT